MGFAERIGLGKPPKQLQVQSMDKDLKVGLWNTYLSEVIRKISNYGGRYEETDLNRYFTFLWHEYFKLAIDQRNIDPDSSLNYVRTKYESYDWVEVYSFLEFNISQDLLIRVHYPFHFFVDETNRILEREFAGYRIIDNIFVPVSNELEIEEINQALSTGKGFFDSAYKGINLHLSDALKKLSDKHHPDYRNSIKESISAVEVLCRQLTGKSTLGDSLKEFENKNIIINPQLKSGIEKLYAYTNSKESGIRHALMENPSLPTFHEAKFMLVTCSAFINFIIGQTKSK